MFDDPSFVHVCVSLPDNRGKVLKQQKKKKKKIRKLNKNANCLKNARAASRRRAGLANARDPFGRPAPPSRDRAALGQDDSDVDARPGRSRPTP